MSSRKKTTLRGNFSHIAKQPIIAFLRICKIGHDWLLGNVGIIPTLYRFLFWRTSLSNLSSWDSERRLAPLSPLPMGKDYLYKDHLEKDHFFKDHFKDHIAYFGGRAFLKSRGVLTRPFDLRFSWKKMHFQMEWPLARSYFHSLSTVTFPFLSFSLSLIHIWRCRR